jgi:hypothetical protein
MSGMSDHSVTAEVNSRGYGTEIPEITGTKLRSGGWRQHICIGMLWDTVRVHHAFQEYRKGATKWSFSAQCTGSRFVWVILYQ